MKKLTKSLWFALILTALLSAASFAAYVLGESDPASRFVDVNKNGSVWTLGYGGNYSSDPIITPYTYQPIASLNLYGWCANGNNDLYGNFLKNCGSTTYDSWQVLSSYWKPGEIIIGTHPSVLQYAQFKAPAAGTYIIDIYGFGRSLNTGHGNTSVDLPYFVKGVRVKTETVDGFEGGSAMIPNPVGDKPTARIADSVYLEAGETVTLGIFSRGDNADENFGLSFKVYAPEDCGHFTGHVVTSGGFPIEGATVAIGDNTTTTDEHGAYELYVLPGTYTATVSKLAYNTVTESATSAAGGEYTKNFVLDYNNAYSTFSGVITDGNGNPVNSVNVTLGSNSTITNASGAFSFTVQNGEYTFTATKTGYDPVTDDVILTGDTSKNYTINLIPVVIEDAYFFPQDNQFHVTAPWSVGKFANTNNNNPNLEPFSVYGPCPEGPISGLVGWWDGANRDVYGNMLMSTYPDVIDTTINGIDLASYREPGDVIVGPMNGAYKLYACFVAPAAGDYLCTAEISNRATPGCDVNVHLYYSGVLVESNNLTGFGGRPGNDYLDAFGNPTKIVSEAVHFDAGDTFMIAIDNNGSAANDAVLLKMAVYSTGFRTVTGKVTDNHGNPVKNAAVNFGRGLTAYTYDNGNYSIALLNGEYNVTASKDGFESDTKEVNTATTGVVNFTLTAEEQEVKDVYILNDNSEFLPEEVWTVGYLNTATDESNPAFIPFVHCTDLVDIGLVGWNADGHNNDIKGNILKNYTDQDMNNVTGEDSPSYVYWPADAMVGASNDDERVCAKFTAPADGTYLLVADYMGRSTFPGKGTSSDVFLYVNGNVVKKDIIRGFAGTDAAGTGSFGMRPKVHFGEEVTLDFGDTVYFAFNGGGDAAAFDSLGVDFRVYTAGNYFTVSGTVTDTNGQPLEGASLVFGNSTVTTDANGGYEILLGKGDYDVSVNKDGYLAQTDSASVNEDLTMNFVLEEEILYTVSGNITTGNSKYYGSGQPLAGAVVTAGEASASTDENGNYTLAVPAGGYLVTATYPGSVVSDAKELTVNDNVTDFDFTLDYYESGNVYYIDPVDGDDWATGEEDSPWQSMNNGDLWEMLQPGDKIVLKAGIHTPLEPSEAGFLFELCAGDRLAPIVIEGEDGTVVTQSDLMSDDATGHEAYVAGITLNTSYFVLDNITFENCQIGVDIRGDGNVVYGCTFTDIKKPAGDTSVPRVAGVRLADAYENVIVKSLFKNFTESANHAETTAVFTNVANLNRVINNTFDGMACAFGSMGTANGLNFDNVFMNNIVMNVASPTNTSCVCRNNVYWQNGAAPATTDPSDINADPMLDADYQISSASSSAVDAGKDLGYEYKGNAPDCGAFESDYTYVPPAAEEIDSLDDLADLADGTLVTNNFILVAVNDRGVFTDSSVYAENEDRLAGVKLDLSGIRTSVDVGDVLTVTGTVASDADGKYIVVKSVESCDPSSGLGALALTNTSLDNNVLVRVWGKVVSAAGDTFVINNGSGDITVKGATAGVGGFVTVTGVATKTGVRAIEVL